MDGKWNIHSNKLFANGEKRIGVRVKVVTFQTQMSANLKISRYLQATMYMI
jgi:hypothetical protein